MQANQLPQSLKNLWNRANAAIETKNYSYAVSLIYEIVKNVPTFLEGRIKMRQAAILETKNKKRNINTAGVKSLQLHGRIKKDPLGVILEVEKALATDPLSPQLNTLLYDASIQAELDETASFALKTIIQGHPRDTDVLHKLGEYYIDREKTEEAMEVYNRILEIDPTDIRANKASKDASALTSMKKGGWGENASYRDLIKNKDQASLLEKQSRAIQDADSINSLLAELNEKYEENNEDLQVVRKMADLYLKRDEEGDFDLGIQLYEWALHISKGDPVIERKITDLKLENMQKQVREYSEAIKSNPDNPEVEEWKKTLKILRIEKNKFELSVYQDRVKRNPTDTNLRYDLAEVYYKLGDPTSAISHLQKALSNPSLRTKVMTLLGLCHERKGQHDMAVKRFEDAIKEIPSMTAEKKNLLYNLGIIYEKMSDKNNYIDCMKQIYEVDYNYKDVSQRVESSYSSS